MNRQLFYEPLLHPDMIFPSLFRVNEAESHHALRALRLAAGDTLSLTDGKGYFYTAEIAGTNGKSLEVILLTCVETTLKPAASLHLAISPLKNPDRLEWLVEKAVETGVHSLSLLICERTEKPRVNTERLERIAISALKQSLHAWLPPIRGPLPFDAFLAEPVFPRGFIAWCEEDSLPLWKTCSPGESATLMIGPEGDFTVAETRSAMQRGYSAVSLGRHRLRSETAGLAGILAFQLVNENL